jgi:hypothetical protein
MVVIIGRQKYRDIILSKHSPLVNAFYLGRFGTQLCHYSWPWRVESENRRQASCRLHLTRGREIFASSNCRVARWFIFKLKIPTWVHFGGPWNGKDFLYFIFMIIWNIL